MSIFRSYQLIEQKLELSDNLVWGRLWAGAGVLQAFWLAKKRRGAEAHHEDHEAKIRIKIKIRIRIRKEAHYSRVQSVTESWSSTKIRLPATTGYP